MDSMRPKQLVADAVGAVAPASVIGLIAERLAPADWVTPLRAMLAMGAARYTFLVAGWLALLSTSFGRDVWWLQINRRGVPAATAADAASGLAEHHH
jgi:hypothetical protein